MDPFSAIQSIIAIGVEIDLKLREYRDLPSESHALRSLVHSVESVLKRAADELMAGLLSQSAVIDALKGVEESLAQCHKVISRITRKNKFITFFMAGLYVSDLKSASTRLANQLGAFQAALGMDLRRDTRQEFQSVRQGLVDLELSMLRCMEEQAASFRFVFEQQMSLGSRDDVQLRRVLQECLQNAGMGASSCFSKEDMDKAIQECKQDMDKTIQECRLEKQNLEAAYLEEISKLLLSMQEGSSQHESAAAAALSAADRANGNNINRMHHRSLPSVHMDAIDVPRSFLCPVTLSIMRDPVMLVATGHSFERAAIERHLSVSSTDPLTNKPLYCKELMTNFRLQEIIQEWLVANGLAAPVPATACQQPQFKDVHRTSQAVLEDKGTAGGNKFAVQQGIAEPDYMVHTPLDSQDGGAAIDLDTQQCGQSQAAELIA